MTALQRRAYVQVWVVCDRTGAPMGLCSLLPPQEYWSSSYSTGSAQQVYMVVSLRRTDTPNYNKSNDEHHRWWSHFYLLGPM